MMLMGCLIVPMASRTEQAAARQDARAEHKAEIAQIAVNGLSIALKRSIIAPLLDKQGWCRS